MEPHEAFKKYRVETGWTIQQFAVMTEISKNALVGYENGRVLLADIPLQKSIRIFSRLPVKIQDFYQEYFDFEEQVESQRLEWLKKNPKDMKLVSLKSKYYCRIQKMKERGQLDKTELEQLSLMYDQTFKELRKESFGNPLLTEEQYNTYILPLSYRIRKILDKEYDDVTVKRINECILKKDMSYKQVAFLMNITPSGFALGVQKNVAHIKIGNAMKLSFALKEEFETLFSAFL